MHWVAADHSEQPAAIKLIAKRKCGKRHASPPCNQTPCAISIARVMAGIAGGKPHLPDRLITCLLVRTRPYYRVDLPAWRSAMSFWAPCMVSLKSSATSALLGSQPWGFIVCQKTLSHHVFGHLPIMLEPFWRNASIAEKPLASPAFDAIHLFQGVLAIVIAYARPVRGCGRSLLPAFAVVQQLSCHE